MNGPARNTVLNRIAWALLWLFVFSIPWEKVIDVPGVGTFCRLLGIVAFAAGAAAAIERRSLRPPNLALLLAALFVAWASLTYFWTVDSTATLGRIRTFVQLFGMVWLIWDQCRSAGRQIQLLQAYAFGSVVGAASTFLRYSQHEQTYYRRYAAEGFEPNDFGLVMALAVPLASYLALRTEGKMRWVYRAIVAIVIAAVFLTASRTALVATFVGFLFLAFTFRRSRLEQRISAVVLFALLVLGLVRLAPPAARNRLATLTHEATRGTFHGRTRIWKTGLKVLKSHPVLGIGSGAYPEAVRPWLGVPDVPGHQYVAHNTFLSVLVETGLAGFSSYGLLLVTVFVFAWVMPYTERILWWTMLAVWATGVSTLTWEQNKPTWLIVALILTAWAQAFTSEDRTA